MKTGFIENGSCRFRRGKEAALWKLIEAKYADMLQSASFLKKMKIKFQMRGEFLRRLEEGHEPSPGTLW